MAAITEWVRSLVVLVVLASLLEMLLPMGSMKRFVRLAMGLLILLGMVRPIVGLLGGQVAFDPELLLEPAEQLPSVSEIMAEAGRFQERNQDLLLAEAEARLRTAAEGADRKVEGVAEAAVSLQLAGGPSLDTVRVERTTVTVLLGSRFGQVRPVEPVRIGGGEADQGTAPGARPPLPAEAPLAEAVRREVAARLGITDLRSVTVLIERGESPGR